MKKTTLIFLAIFSFNYSIAQVPRKVVVEHFTNSVCSVCASRNPGFFSNLNSQSEVIHMAVHPSSPYSSCILNQHNVSENDGRTNYYGIYGSTPRLVIQGVVQSGGANYGSPTIFTPYLGQNTPASIKIYQTKYSTDSIRSRIVIKTEATHTLGNLKLFVALAEDTIFYTSPNGESRHYNVFRKSLTGATGVTVNLPPAVGDSIVYTMSSAANVAWDFARIFTIAILQEEATKSVVQSEWLTANADSSGTGITNQPVLNTEIKIFSSDKNILISQTIVAESLSISVYDVTGKKIIENRQLTSKTEVIPLPSTSTGIYFYDIRAKKA